MRKKWKVFNVPLERTKEDKGSKQGLRVTLTLLVSVQEAHGSEELVPYTLARCIPWTKPTSHKPGYLGAMWG